MASDVKIWTGTAWESLKGQQGPAGPTVVSADVGNFAKLGTDNRILVSQTDIDARYVNVTGDAMTGILTTSGSGASQGVEFRATGNNGASAQLVAVRFDSSASGPFFQLHKGRGTSGSPTGVVSGDFLGTMAFVTRAASGPITSAQISVSATGTTTATNTPVQMSFAVSDGTAAATNMLILRTTGVTVPQASLNGDGVADRPLTAITASRALALTDRCRNLANASTGTADVVITIPANSAAPFPIGTTFNIFDLSPTSATTLAAAAGVILNWNATLTGAAAAVAGGVAASVTLPSPLSRVLLVKTAADTWVVFN